MRNIVVPILQIRSNTIIEYNSYEYCDLKPRLRQNEFTANLLQQNTYTGLLTPGSKRRLTKAAELLIQSSRRRFIVNPETGKYRSFRLAFVTLTISNLDNKKSCEVQKTCLQPFLQWLRRVNACYNYLWKAELQKRGQIHYHFTIDVFIPQTKLREKWNELQYRAGYLKGVDLSTYLKTRGTDVCLPASTEIKDVKHYDRVASYISKKVQGVSDFMESTLPSDIIEKRALYKSNPNTMVSLVKELNKDIQNQLSVFGKIWDCSMNLKQGKYYSTELDYEYAADLERMEKAGELERVVTETCRIYKFLHKDAASILKAKDRRNYNRQMSIMRRAIVNPAKVKMFNLPETVPLVTGSRFKKPKALTLFDNT